MTIREWQKAVHALARAKGWWDEWQEAVHALTRAKGWWDEPSPTFVLAKLALVHSEISEAVECARVGEYCLRNDDGKPEGLVVELADAVIRILDLAEALDLDIEQAMEQKHAYNATRSYRHGGKQA